MIHPAKESTRPITPMSELSLPMALDEGDPPNEIHSAGARTELVSIFPGVRGLVGERQFNSLSVAYNHRHELNRQGVNWYGADFMFFLAQQMPGGESECITQMAQFEWAIHYSKAIQAVPFQGVEKIVQTSPMECENMVLSLHPSVTLMTMKWNVPQIWESMNTELTIEIQPLVRKNQRVMAWRDGDLNSRWRELSAQEFELLKTVARNHNFYDSFKQVKRKSKIKMDNWTHWAMNCLANWMRTGVMTMDEIQ
jgi:hypothetical protein